MNEERDLWGIVLEMDCLESDWQRYVEGGRTTFPWGEVARAFDFLDNKGIEGTIVELPTSWIRYVALAIRSKTDLDSRAFLCKDRLVGKIDNCNRDIRRHCSHWEGRLPFSVLDGFVDRSDRFLWLFHRVTLSILTVQSSVLSRLPSVSTWHHRGVLACSEDGYFTFGCKWILL